MRSVKKNDEFPQVPIKASIALLTLEGCSPLQPPERTLLHRVHGAEGKCVSQPVTDAREKLGGERLRLPLEFGHFPSG